MTRQLLSVEHRDVRFNQTSKETTENISHILMEAVAVNMRRIGIV